MAHLLHTTWKYLWRFRLFTTINLAGLAIGLCAFYFAIVYVRFETGYDDFNRYASRIYRVVTDVQTTTGTNYESTSAPVAPALQADFPQIQDATRIFLDDLIIQKDETDFSDEEIAYADASLFRVFTLPLLQGNPGTVLDAPYKIVLSETAAKRYFGNGAAVGKTLLLEGKYPALVTGIMKDMPYNAQWRTDILVSLSTLLEAWNKKRATNWKMAGFYTYLLLRDDRAADRLAGQLPRFVKDHFPPGEESYSLHLEPLRSVYLHARPRGSRTGSVAHGNAAGVYLFSVVAVFILILAALNFISLSVAVSLKRVQDASVRKILGATRHQLRLQLIMEAVVVSMAACVIALLLAGLCLPFFNSLAGKSLERSVFDHGGDIGLLFAAGLVTGLLSGLYPALFLGNANPVKGLKGHYGPGIHLRWTGTVLVTLQFIISVTLMIATLVIRSQNEYMLHQDLGFQKDHLAVIDFRFDPRIVDHEESIKTELSAIPGVRLTSIGSAVIGRPVRQLDMAIENQRGHMVEVVWDYYAVDRDFMDQYGLQLAAGRNFSDSMASDSNRAVIINESGAKNLGYRTAGEALGKRVLVNGHSLFITGVVKDFHFASYNEEIRPIVMRIYPWFSTFITVRFSSGNMKQTLDQVEQTIRSRVPGLPFSYSFSDEDYDAQYRDDIRFGRLFICLTSVATFICCLGLYALSLYSVTQKTRETGIRKLLGASPWQIFSYLSAGFIRPVVVAVLVASPLAGLLMNQWLLRNYAYHVHEHFWIFMAAALLAITVSVLVISHHTIRAIIVNPARSLRAE